MDDQTYIELYEALFDRYTKVVRENERLKIENENLNKRPMFPPTLPEQPDPKLFPPTEITC